MKGQRAMKTESQTYVYHVIDSRTGSVMGVYLRLTTASRKANKLDNEYGAVRYVTRRHYLQPAFETAQAAGV
jgi:hypothetical protein